MFFCNRVGELLEFLLRSFHCIFLLVFCPCTSVLVASVTPLIVRDVTLKRDMGGVGRYTRYRVDNYLGDPMCLLVMKRINK